MKKIIAFTLCILALLPALFSCGKETETEKENKDLKNLTVMTCGDYTVSGDFFKYYLATYKGKFAKMYSDFSDDAEYYATMIDENGTTVEEYLFDTTVESVKMTLAGCALFDEYGLELADSIYDAVDEYIDALLLDYAGGDEEAFDNALMSCGIDRDALREIYLLDERVAALLDFLLDEGEIEVTDEDRTDYLNENYVRVRHIYVNTKYKYSTDEDGYLIYTAEGYAQTEPLTEDELDKKLALTAAVDESLAEGGDFDEIYEGLSEDKLYANGYYLMKTTDFIPEVVNAAFSLEVGEWVKVESDYGTHYIMRLEMDESPWADSANSEFFGSFDETISTELFKQLIIDNTDRVTVNEDALTNFSIIDSPINYKF